MQEPSQVIRVDVAGCAPLVLRGDGEPGQQRAHRSALVGKDPDVALRAGQRDRLGQGTEGAAVIAMGGQRQRPQRLNLDDTADAVLARRGGWQSLQQ
jgi:hypothetical protein